MNTEKTLPKAWESIDTKLAKGTYNGSASDLKTLIDGKESSISKKSGFNLDKSDAINSNATTTLATSAAVKTAYDKGVEALTNSNTKLTKGNLPAKITNAEDMYKLLENKSGLEFDPNLLYLNDAGTKTAGKAYFDRNKKGIFKCIQTTSSTTNSTTYFVDFSNNANSDRLANLFEIYSYAGDGTSIKTVDLGIPKDKEIKFAVIFSPGLSGNTHNAEVNSGIFLHTCCLIGYIPNQVKGHDILAQFNKDNTLTVCFRNKTNEQIMPRFNVEGYTYFVFVVF